MQLSLREWQERFRAGVREGSEVADLFSPSGGPTLAARVAVYRNGYLIRVGGSLEEDFSLTRRLLGRVRFAALIKAFLPQKSGFEIELGGVSAGFAEFLRREIPKSGLWASVQLDLLALRARRAPDREPGKGAFGLHPSAHFYVEDGRRFALWRQKGSVRRARLSPEVLRLLECFVPAAPLEEIGARLAGLGLEPGFLQATVAEWAACEMITEEKGPPPR